MISGQYTHSTETQTISLALERHFIGIIDSDVADLKAAIEEARETLERGEANGLGRQAEVNSGFNTGNRGSSDEYTLSQDTSEQVHFGLDRQASKSRHLKSTVV